MMASSSSSSNLSDHLVQDDLPWPSSSSLPFAPAPHSAIIGGNHQWCQQPLMLNCADHHHPSDGFEVLLSEQGHHHHASPPLALIPPQLSSLLMMQDLGFQWSNCSFAADASSMAMNGYQQDGNDDKIKMAPTRSSSCAGTAIAYHDIADLDGGAVLPSVNISRTHQRSSFPAAPPPLPSDAFEILASSRLCKSLLLSQASSVLLHNAGLPLLRSEHVPYGPPPPAAAVHHPQQGPSIDNYRQMGSNGEGGARHWSAEHDAARQKAAARPAPSPSPSLKKPRVEQLQRSSTTMVPSFKTDTASVLMEAIGYIKFLQDQVETLSGPYLKSSRNKKPKTTQRGSSKASAGEQEETRLDLRSRGLCLVPLSCTSYVTNENGVWAPPSFRGN